MLEALRTRSNTGLSHPYLAKCVYQSVLESHPPHKIVNILRSISIRNIKLTVLLGSWLSKTN